jgi:hypothetical protein
LRSGFAFAHASNATFHSSWAALPRSSALRVCSITSGATSNVLSGSKPRVRLVAASSSAPSAEPWILPEFCLCGAGQPMIVRRMMSDGLSVTPCAASMAACNSCTSSS